MCGRYASFRPAEAIARIFGTKNPLPDLAPSWNVAPTQDAAVVRRHPETDARHLDLLKWACGRTSVAGPCSHGFRRTAARSIWSRTGRKEPTKAQRPINARSETAAAFNVPVTKPDRRRGRTGGCPRQLPVLGIQPGSSAARCAGSKDERSTAWVALSRISSATASPVAAR
jgi:hypothetical protein